MRDKFISMVINYSSGKEVVESELANCIAAEVSKHKLSVREAIRAARIELRKKVDSTIRLLGSTFKLSAG
ncbi:MAG: hypothetical protein QXK94_03860 [Candidatus Jordarchaeales archaeon]